jgi:hypothetical protein
MKSSYLFSHEELVFSGCSGNKKYKHHVFTIPISFLKSIHIIKRFKIEIKTTVKILESSVKTKSYISVSSISSLKKK